MGNSTSAAFAGAFEPLSSVSQEEASLYLKRYKELDLDFGIDQATLEFLMDMERGNASEFIQEFDNGSGIINALDFLCGLGLACRGSPSAKIQFVFDAFDFDGSGKISLDEMTIMLVSSLHGLSVMTGKIGEPSEDYLEELSYVAFKEADYDSNDSISKEEFARWVSKLLDYNGDGDVSLEELGRKFRVLNDSLDPGAEKDTSDAEARPTAAGRGNGILLHVGSEPSSLKSALEGKGWNVEAVAFSDDNAATIEEKIKQSAFAVVRIDPIDQENATRSVLDSVLAKAAGEGLPVFDHPDVIEQFGTKSALFKLRELGFSYPDTYLYPDIDTLRETFVKTLLTGPRVLKRNRSANGVGVWRVAIAAEGEKEEISGSDEVEVTNAANNEVSRMPLEEFFKARGDDFGTGPLVDQRFLPSISEGEQRVVVVRDTPVRVEHRKAASEGAFSTTYSAGGISSSSAVDASDNQGVMEVFRAELPKMMELLGMKDENLPLVWALDFIKGDEQPAYVLCDINCANVKLENQDIPYVVEAIASRLPSSEETKAEEPKAEEAAAEEPKADEAAAEEPKAEEAAAEEPKAEEATAEEPKAGEAAAEEPKAEEASAEEPKAEEAAAEEPKAEEAAAEEPKAEEAATEEPKAEEAAAEEPKAEEAAAEEPKAEEAAAEESKAEEAAAEEPKAEEAAAEEPKAEEAAAEEPKPEEAAAEEPKAEEATAEEPKAEEAAAEEPKAEEAAAEEPKAEEAAAEEPKAEEEAAEEPKAEEAAAEEAKAEEATAEEPKAEEPKTEEAAAEEPKAEEAATEEPKAEEATAEEPKAEEAAAEEPKAEEAAAEESKAEEAAAEEPKAEEAAAEESKAEEAAAEEPKAEEAAAEEPKAEEAAAEEPKAEEAAAEEPKPEEAAAEEPKAEEAAAEEAKAEEAAAEEPKAEEAAAEEPKAEEAAAEEPKAEEAAAEEPKAEEAAAEDPKAEEVAAEEPKAE